MSSSDAVTDRIDERTDGLASSLSESLGPKVARHAQSGNLAAASGAVSLARAGRTFLKGNRKRGLLQAAVGLVWVGVALAQQRTASHRRTGGHSGAEMAEVVGTSPNVEDAVEPGTRGTEQATGEEVVDTSNVDVEESDTAPEVGASPEIEREIADEDVDQRDVVGTDEVESAADEGESGEESASESDDETTDADDQAETGSAE